MSLENVIEQESTGGSARISYGRAGGEGIWIGIFKGVYDEGICESSLLTGSAAVAQEERVHFFFDWSGLKRYDTSARARATQWCVKHRRNIIRIDFLTRNAFIRMGVTVANLVVKNELVVVEDRAEMVRHLGELLGVRRNFVPLYAEIAAGKDEI